MSRVGALRNTLKHKLGWLHGNQWSFILNGNCFLIRKNTFMKWQNLVKSWMRNIKKMKIGELRDLIPLPMHLRTKIVLNCSCVQFFLFWIQDICCTVFSAIWSLSNIAEYTEQLVARSREDNIYRYFVQYLITVLVYNKMINYECQYWRCWRLILRSVLHYKISVLRLYAEKKE